MRCIFNAAANESEAISEHSRYLHSTRVPMCGYLNAMCVWVHVICDDDDDDDDASGSMPVPDWALGCNKIRYIYFSLILCNSWLACSIERNFNATSGAMHDPHHQITMIRITSFQLCYIESKRMTFRLWSMPTINPFNTLLITFWVRERTQCIHSHLKMDWGWWWRSLTSSCRIDWIRRRCRCVERKSIEKKHDK